MQQAQGMGLVRAADKAVHPRWRPGGVLLLPASFCSYFLLSTLFFLLLLLFFSFFPPGRPVSTCALLLSAWL